MGRLHCKDYSIGEIVKSIDDGDYRIPRFQRDFVWDVKKSAGLVDSILKGFPIGAVILWTTKKKINCVEQKDLGGRPIRGKDTGRFTSYIIDGQQRLTSLFMAIKGESTGDGKDFSKMCVSLIPTEDGTIVYDAMPKNANPNDFVTLKDLYSNVKGEYHQDKRIDYYNTLHQYNISVIEMDDDNLDLYQVVEIFERLNLGGKKLSMFSIVAARCYSPETSKSEGFDLEEKLKALKDKLNDVNYGEIDESTFLQMISACLIRSTKKSDILKNLKEKTIRDNYNDIEKAIFEAIEHLKGDRYGAVVAPLLPFQRLLVPFTYFHYKLKKLKKKQPTQTQENYLVDFYWRCVLDRRYNNAADANMEIDLAKIDVILTGNKPEQESIVLSPKYIFENGHFQTKSSFVLGMLCLMAQNNPKSLTPGQSIIITNDALSKSVKKQYHHFFPRQSKVIQGNSKYKKNVNNVVNIVLMDAATNNKISNKNPSKYIKEYAYNNTKIGSVLKSHYISRKGFGIDKDDYFEFIRARSKELYLQLNNLIIKNKADTITDELPDFE